MQNRTGQKVDVGSRHGMAKVGRQTQPAEQGRCRQTQPADEMAGTGLAVKQPSDDPTGTGLAVNNSYRRSGRYRPRSKTTASRRSWPASRRAVQVGGGSAVVLATQKAGSDLPKRLPPNLSPLPVTVHTHSLNL